jgi:hypothetical protein
MEISRIIDYFSGRLPLASQAEVEIYLRENPDLAQEVTDRLLLFDQLLPDPGLRRLHQVWEPVENGRFRLMGPLRIAYQGGQLAWSGLPAGLWAYSLRPLRSERGAAAGPPPTELGSAARRIMRGEETLQPPLRSHRGPGGKLTRLELTLPDPASPGRLICEVTMQPAGAVLFRFALDCLEEDGMPSEQYAYIELWSGLEMKERSILHQGKVRLSYLAPGAYYIRLGEVCEIPVELAVPNKEENL